ncbi:hypothetical protein [Streptomyces yaizuensis]|uniref:Uncharacterized protein n=1 Tax=Streptomyces yaizuensis TaxID=2989713 RepID=A0ABQ5P477_9ACTN|nr:hypothetical protein [Streptomyces sp. YSPA8]GLF97377.1 hypothetical protein SYYSPA8_23790 [Streptomyces sp. YSPA8]GLF99325.1 hypothetical protein SYYSPA8_33530 [Streptomyces sp. YSPA8]
MARRLRRLISRRVRVAVAVTLYLGTVGLLLTAALPVLRPPAL